MYELLKLCDMFGLAAQLPGLMVCSVGTHSYLAKAVPNLHCGFCEKTVCLVSLGPPPGPGRARAVDGRARVLGVHVMASGGCARPFGGRPPVFFAKMVGGSNTPILDFYPSQVHF